MENNQSKVNPISLYLVKDSKMPIEDILKEEDVWKKYPLTMNNSEATLFIRRQTKYEQSKWFDYILKDQNIDGKVSNGIIQEGAVVLLKAHNNIFLLAFGSGRYLIKTSSVINNFGLGVTMNVLRPEKIKSLYKKTFGDLPLNIKMQSASEIDISKLMLQVNKEKIYALTGPSDNSLFKNKVSGRDAFKFNTCVDLINIENTLKEILSLYQKLLPNKFQNFDDYKIIENKKLASQLDYKLAEIASDSLENEGIFLAEPEVIADKICEYQFLYRNEKHIVESLSLKEMFCFIKTFCQGSDKIHKCHEIVIKVFSEGIEKYQWLAYDCLNAELVYDEKLYWLDSGVWHLVNQELAKKVENFLNKVEILENYFPDYFHQNEAEYNQFVCEVDPSCIHFDKALFKIGSGKSKLEFCDIIKNHSDLIHVKRDKSKASELQYVFNQGKLASQSYLDDVDLRREVNLKLPKEMRLDDVVAIPKAKNYKIVFGIISNRNRPYDFSFSVKKMLVDVVETLTTRGFLVAIAPIKIKTISIKIESANDSIAELEDKIVNS